MSDKSIIVKSVKSNKTFEDEIEKSRTESSTNMVWERDLNEDLDVEGDSTYYTIEFPSKSLSASTLEDSSTHWLIPTSDVPNTVPRKSSSFINPRKNAGENEKDSEGNEVFETPLSYLSMFSRSSSGTPNFPIPTCNPDRICELTADLVEFCIELLFDFSQQRNMSPEEYVEKKFVYEYIDMGDWEMIASIEVFYSCLEKASVLDIVIKGFKRSLGMKIFCQINQFEITQMKVLSFLALYESGRIGVDVLETVLMRFTGQNVRRLYFYLSGQLSFDSPLKMCITNLKSEEYFAQLILPNLVVSSKLMKKVPRAMHIGLLGLNRVAGNHEGLNVSKSSKRKTTLVKSTKVPRKPKMKTDISTHATVSQVSTMASFDTSSISTDQKSSLVELENSTSQGEMANEGEIYISQGAEIENIGNISISNSTEILVDYKRKGDETPWTEKSYTLRSSDAYIGRVLKGPIFRGKETITTVLRERQRLQNLLVSDSFGDYESALRSMEDKQKSQDIKAIESKEEERKRKRLLLQSQLTYHRAIAATRDSQEKKQEIGNELRKVKEFRKLTIEQERQQDLEEKKKQAKLMAEQEMERIRKAMEDSLKKKQEIANKIKKDNEDLLKQSLKREKDEELQRLDTIKKIQAVSAPKPLIISASNIYHETLLRKVYTTKNLVQLNLSKLERKHNLEDTQRKIQVSKREKLNRLSNAQNEIELWRMTNNIKRSMEREITQPETTDTFREDDSDDEELIKIKQELHMLKHTNKPVKSIPGSTRRLV